MINFATDLVLTVTFQNEPRRLLGDAAHSRLGSADCLLPRGLYAHPMRGHAGALAVHHTAVRKGFMERNSTYPARKMTTIAWAFLAVLLLLALWVRFGGLSRGFFVDELNTVKSASLPLGDLLAERSTPLLFLLSKPLVALSAKTGIPLEFCLRTPHLLFSLATVALAFVLLLRWGGLVAAVLGGLLMVLSKEHIAYSTNARYYALIMLLCVAVPPLTLECLQKHRVRDWFLLGVLILAGMLNHLSFAAFLAPAMFGTFCGLLFDSTVSRRDRIIRAGILVAVGVVAAVAFLVLLLIGGGTPAFMRLLYLLKLATPPPGTVIAPDSVEAMAVSGKTYQLSLAQYSIFLGRFIPGGGGAGPYLLAVSVFLGLIILWFRKRPLFFPFFCVIVLLPLPLFVIHASHWWSARYFLPQLPFLLMAAGLGAGGIVTLLLDLLPRYRTWVEAGISLAIVLAAFAANPPWAMDADTVYEPVPDHHMRDVAARILPSLDTEGLVLLVPQSIEGWHPLTILDFYLQRGNRACASVLRECPDLACVEAALKEKPAANAWVVTPNDTLLRRMTRVSGGDVGLQELTGGLSQACLPPVEVGDTLIWRRPAVYTGYKEDKGAPQLLPSGTLEGELPGGKLPEGAELVASKPSADAGRALQLSVSADTDPANRPTPTVWFPVSVPAKLRDTSPKAYLLCFDVKSDSVQPGTNPARTVRVMVSGNGFWKDVFFVSGTHDWERRCVRLETGKDFPASPKGAKIGFGHRGGTGTVWFADIRLQPVPDSDTAAPSP